MPEPAGILLAAGRSTRFGADKLLHPLPDGMPVGVAAATRLLRATPRTLVVIRADNPALSESLGQLGCELVVNPRADRGMGSGIAAGGPVRSPGAEPAG